MVFLATEVVTHANNCESQELFTGRVFVFTQSSLDSEKPIEIPGWKEWETGPQFILT
jgi:hypothetical protein